MRTRSESGSAIVVVILSVLLVGSLGLGVWAFLSRQDYKNNSDQKAEKTAALAVEKAKTEKDNEFVEKEKQPLKNYHSQASLAEVNIKYPKTWSAYISESGKGSTPLDGTMHSDYVQPATDGIFYALRFQLKDTPYDTELKTYDSLLKTGKVKVSAYRLPSVPSVLGARIEGEIAPGKTGLMVILPVRDKTLKVWTESSQFFKDFDGIILPNLSFVP